MIATVRATSDCMVEIQAPQWGLAHLLALQTTLTLHLPEFAGAPIDWCLSDGRLAGVLRHAHCHKPITALVQQLEEFFAQGFKPDSTPSARSPKQVHLPIQLGGPSGLDFVQVLQSLELSPQQFASQLADLTLTVQFCGFLPGFAYLTGLPERWAQLPRHRSPRAQVPAQSFAMAAGYCAVYPWASPGGWQLLGHCTCKLFDAAAEQPALLSPGDQVKFDVLAVLPC